MAVKIDALVFAGVFTSSRGKDADCSDSRCSMANAGPVPGSSLPSSSSPRFSSKGTTPAAALFHRDSCTGSLRAGQSHTSLMRATAATLRSRVPLTLAKPGSQTWSRIIMMMFGCTASTSSNSCPAPWVQTTADMKKMNSRTNL